jgi:pimeloyl-ACP methyl ester carboxylesterase
MRVDIGGGFRLFFDVDGPSLAPSETEMIERPTLILLHGGPGFDHSGYKPAFSQFTDICQVIYLDHRGQGRSDRGSPDDWTLDTWADDIVRFCDALEIEKPIVLGNSFGGMVAQRYGHRHPGHAAKLVFSSTAANTNIPAIVAMFRQLGGDEPARIAEAFWKDPTMEHQKIYLAACGPFYTRRPGNLFDEGRTVRNPAVLMKFFEPKVGEGLTFDELPHLGKVASPTLVLAGGLDPVCPKAGSDLIVEALPKDLVRYEVFDDAGHGVFRDDPDRAFAVLREFILS